MRQLLHIDQVLKNACYTKKKNVKANDFGCRYRPCFKLYKLLVDYSYANVKCRGLFSNLFMDNNKVNDIITCGSVY